MSTGGRHPCSACDGAQDQPFSSRRCPITANQMEKAVLARLAREFDADVRYALRQMRRRLAFTGTVVLTLGLGIGATIALLSVVNALLLRPLPYANEERVRVFWMDYNWRGEEYDFVRERPGVFQNVAAFS